MRRFASFTVVAAIALAAAPAANAAGWSHAASFKQRPGAAAPRIAIATDGTSAAVWLRDREVLVSTGDRHAHFTAAHGIGQSIRYDAAAAVAAGPAGVALVAWEATDGIRVAFHGAGEDHWAVHVIAPSTASSRNAVTVAYDPRGGWFVAERQYPRTARPGLGYRIRVVTLRANGVPALQPQDLGPGRFGLEGRPLGVLSVNNRGQATLAFSVYPIDGPVSRATVMLASGIHAGHFGQLRALPATGELMDPWVSQLPNGDALVAATRVARCSSAGCFGAPFAWGSAPQRPLGGPTLPDPGLAFAPSIAPLADKAAALVFALKPARNPYSYTAPVRAMVIRADGSTGPLQRLTDSNASGVEALPLSSNRVLVLWAGPRGFGAALAGGDGVFHKTTAPGGPPPVDYGGNRDARTAGSWAAIAWQQGERVRMRIRHF